jgi:hypothetical protein
VGEEINREVDVNRASRLGGESAMGELERF